MKLSGHLNAFLPSREFSSWSAIIFSGWYFRWRDFPKKNFYNLLRFLGRQPRVFPPLPGTFGFLLQKSCPVVPVKECVRTVWHWWLLTGDGLTLWSSFEQRSFLTWLLAIPACCGPCFRNWEILPLRPSLSKMVRSGSLLVLGFSRAHFPNLQGILTSVGILSTLQGILLMRLVESPAIEICFSQSIVHESLPYFFWMLT